jgi:tetratricopeptide (TPR) repeat protein
VELTSDNPRGYSNLGVIAYAQKRYDEAAQMYEKSVGIKPTDPAYSNLGALYFSLGRYSDAARNFQQAIQMNGRDSRRWHNLAAAYQWSNERGKARAAFQRTAELAEKQRRVNARDPALLLELADAYSMLNQRRRARKVLQQALDLTPESVDDMFQAAVVYEQIEDREHALQWIARAIKGGYSRDLIDKAPSLTLLRLDPRYQGLFGP